MAQKSKHNPKTWACLCFVCPVIVSLAVTHQHYRNADTPQKAVRSIHKTINTSTGCLLIAVLCTLRYAGGAVSPFPLQHTLAHTHTRIQLPQLWNPFINHCLIPAIRGPAICLARTRTSKVNSRYFWQKVKPFFLVLFSRC